jgi:hypothetical protein
MRFGRDRIHKKAARNAASAAPVAYDGFFEPAVRDSLEVIKKACHL